MPAWQMENLGPESRKAHLRRLQEDFFDRYFGPIVIDIGYRGYEEMDVVPVLPDAIGIDLSYPGYDGKKLPFENCTVDTVYASHTLEHINDPMQSIREWFRVLKVGGYLVIGVPHQFLYEKRTELPSRWNGDHRRFYTPAKLMLEVEAALPPNTYRLRRLMDDDEGYDYLIPPSEHAGGAYQIELVLQKIHPPEWVLDGPSTTTSTSLMDLKDFEGKLQNIFLELYEATKIFEQHQQNVVYRLEGLESQIQMASKEIPLGKTPVSEEGQLSYYMRHDVVPIQDVVTTTRFFRNRLQHQTLLANLPLDRAMAHPHVLVVGCSRGCEAYSLGVEAQLMGLNLVITAIDIDSRNIELALEGVYDQRDFIDFDNTSLLAPDTTPWFDREGNTLRVNSNKLATKIRFEVGDLFQHKGIYDAVICNNVLIHFSDEASAQAFSVLDLLVAKEGVLAVGGVSLDVLVSSFNRLGNLRPISDHLEIIWEGWKGDRRSWEMDPGSYVGMPPIDYSYPDWSVRFCSLFKKTVLALDSPQICSLWLRHICASLSKAKQQEEELVDYARAMEVYLEKILRVE